MMRFVPTESKRLSSQLQRRILITASTLFFVTALCYSVKVIFFSIPLVKKTHNVRLNPLGGVAALNQTKQIRPAIEDFEKIWHISLQANKKKKKTPPSPVIKKKKARPKATLVLRGIFFQSDKASDSFAILAPKGQQQSLLRRVGQSIGDQDTVLTAIYIDHVEVKYSDGTIDRLNLPKPK